MLGLLGLGDWEDPRRQALLAASAHMLASRGNTAQGVGQGLLGAMQAYQQAGLLKDKKAQEAQEREQRQMLMEQQRQAMADRQGMRSAFQGAFNNPNLVQNDDMGNPMPQAPSQFDAAKFMSSAAPYMDPMQAMSLMPKPRAPMVLSKGARAFDETGREIAANPEIERPESKFAKLNPADFTPDSFRKFVASGNYADLVPYRKPDAPKTQEPRLYDGPEGPVWVTPPVAGQPGQTLPVTDPTGKPISAKKRNQPVTEAQAKAKLYVGMMDDAEQALAGVKFDPTKLSNQTEIMLARGDLPRVPKVIQNSMAAKEAQLYAQSTFQWTEAMLRQLTGAAAPEPEVWRQVKTYWPQPGDTKEVVKRKERARQAVTEQVRGIAGTQESAPTKDDPLGIR